MNLHKEDYKINGAPCRVVADFANNIINIHARAFSQSYPMDEYVNFTGDMKAFAKHKINGGEK